MYMAHAQIDRQQGSIVTSNVEREEEREKQVKLSISAKRKMESKPFETEEASSEMKTFFQEKWKTTQHRGIPTTGIYEYF